MYNINIIFDLWFVSFSAWSAPLITASNVPKIFCVYRALLSIFQLKSNSSLIHALKYIKYINETYQIYSTTRMLLQSLPDAACSFSTPSAPYQVWTTGNIQIFFSIIIIITAYIERKHTSKGWSKVYIRTVVRISHYQWMAAHNVNSGQYWLVYIWQWCFANTAIEKLWQLKSSDVFTMTTCRR